MNDYTTSIPLIHHLQILGSLNNLGKETGLFTFEKLRYLKKYETKAKSEIESLSFHLEVAKGVPALAPSSW